MALVNQAGDASNGAVDSLDVTIPATTPGHALIVLAADWDNHASAANDVTPSGGGVTTWVEAGSAPFFDARDFVTFTAWVGVVDTEATEVTVACPAAAWIAAGVTEWSEFGDDFAAAFVAQDQTGNNPSQSVTIPDACLLALATVSSDSDAFGTAPTGGTALADVGTSGVTQILSSQYTLAPSAGTIAYGWTLSGRSVTAALTITGSGGGGTTGEIDGTLSGSGTLAASASPTVPASGALSGAGSLAASARPTVPVDGELTGTGTLSGSASPTVPVTGELAGSGTLTGQLTTGPTLDGQLSGTGTLAAEAAPTVPLPGALSGSGALAGRVAPTVPLAGALGGAGQLTAEIAPTAPMTGVLAGTGHLIGTLTVPNPLVGALSSSGTLTGTLTKQGTVVTPASRVYRVPAENRIYKVPAEARVHRVPAENRIYKVPASDRIYNAQES